MPIVIRKSGSKTVRVSATAFPNEANLQEQIAESPECLPLDDIEESLRLMVIGREFPTSAGEVDVLAASADGTIYVIETKLFRNPDKRLVVAQVLDYGAALWRACSDTPMSDQIDRFLARKSAEGLKQRLQDFFHLDVEVTNGLVSSINDRAGGGLIRFIVVMDSVHDQLKTMVSFLNDNSNFTLFAVEIEYYKHDGIEILIPKLFGSTKKAAISRSVGRADAIGTRESMATKLEELVDDSDLDLYNWLIDYGEGAGRRGLCTLAFIDREDPAAHLVAPRGKLLGIWQYGGELWVRLLMTGWKRGNTALAEKAIAELAVAIGEPLKLDTKQMPRIDEALRKPTISRPQIELALDRVLEALQ